MSILNYALNDDYLEFKHEMYSRLKSMMRNHPIVKEYIRVNDNLDTKLKKFKEIKEIK